MLLVVYYDVVGGVLGCCRLCIVMLLVVYWDVVGGVL